MRKNERGMSLAEVLVALGVLSIIVFFSSTMASRLARGTQDNLNKQFATQKAISMLEELRALVQTESGATTVVLDDYDDGATNQVLLTTRTDITDPAHVVSGNRKVGAQWLFERRIVVERVKGANDVRLVNVKVFVREKSGPRLLAEVAGVLNTVGQAMPPTQVYDVYLLAVENVPGWWLYMQDIVPFVESAMADLQTRHPGLEFRQHWIRKLSYGRDPFYTPHVNREVPSTDAIPSVYFYPGLLPDGSAVANYYPPDFFNGQVSVDGVLTNGFDADTNPLPYALADQFNNGMRHPDERALFDARVAAKLEAADTPTLRLLLDDMSMHPGRYRNAIIINLHGELFPFPPVRNYSDAAKDPDAHPYVRAVTHPEQLTYGNAEDVSLRVYSHHANPSAPGTVPDWLGKDSSPTAITVTLKGIQWMPPLGSITAISGGVDFDDDTSPDPYAAVGADTTPQTTSAPTSMWYSVEIAGGDTVLKLYNSPLKSPCATDASACDQGGLDPSSSLYALEYIPSPVEDLPDATSPAAFTTNLATAGTGAKNTARWVIRIPDAKLPDDALITVETRIADTASAMPNVSRTFVWRGSDVWLYGDATNDPHLPITERFQLLGDPRHLPYADLKLPHAASERVRKGPLGMGYNRYFDDFHNGAENAASRWTGWSYDAPALSGKWFGVKNNTSDTDDANDAWTSAVELDMPRIFEVLRSAITGANAVYTTMTGFSYYYVGIGNEIGYDSANGFPNSIPVSSRPFDGTNGTRNEQSITSALSGGVKYIRENAPVADYWWAMTWLGELYPDSAWDTWSTTGNLPAGTGAGTFSRVRRGAIDSRLPSGTTLRNTQRRTAEEGSTTFFWSGEDTKTFHHRYQDGTTGTLVAEGADIASTFSLPMPASISINRPFDVDVDDTSMNPEHFLQHAYGAATKLEPLAEFYRHQSNIYGSALLAMRDGEDASFVVVNGLSPTGESGAPFMARWSFLSLIQSFMTAGRYSSGGTLDPARVRLLPRVVITAPTDQDDIVNPTSLDVKWQTTWRRWDGLPYTPAFPDDFSEDTTVRYALLYSRDNGRTWLYMKDDQPATRGVRPPDDSLQTAATFTWSVPASKFPKGNYVIRVEAYRDEVPLHYSFHQYRAFFKRS